MKLPKNARNGLKISKSLGCAFHFESEFTHELSIKSLENAAFHTDFLFFINGIYCVTEALDLLTKYIHGSWVILSKQLTDYTANVFNVIFTLFTCVPLSTAISLYYLHLIPASGTIWQ